MRTQLADGLGQRVSFSRSSLDSGVAPRLDDPHWRLGAGGAGGVASGRVEATSTTLLPFVSRATDTAPQPTWAAWPTPTCDQGYSAPPRLRTSITIPRRPRCSSAPRLTWPRCCHPVRILTSTLCHACRRFAAVDLLFCLPALLLNMDSRHCSLVLGSLCQRALAWHALAFLDNMGDVPVGCPAGLSGQPDHRIVVGVLLPLLSLVRVARRTALRTLMPTALSLSLQERSQSLDENVSNPTVDVAGKVTL